MKQFLEEVLDQMQSRIERILSEVFEAGAAFAKDEGPDFDTWLAERRKNL